MVFIVAIDGPAGSGKSSVAKAVAKHLGLAYVDTGAIYRTLAYDAIGKSVSLQDGKALADLAANLAIEFVPTSQGQKVLLDGNDVSKAIRTEDISKNSSVVGRHPEVRTSLLELQRRLGRESPSGAVLEGRDIGTVVFPDADLKFFITASDEQRAKRRFLELKDRGEPAQYETVLAEIKDRDHRDSKREAAPLVAAKDAKVIDTTQHAMKEVIELIETQIRMAMNQVRSDP